MNVGGLPPASVDPGIKQWATEKQARCIDAVIEHGGFRPAARALGIQMNAVREAVRTVERKAAAAGYSPQHDMTRTVPEPFVVRGVSTYYNKEGKPSGQWVKSRMDDARWREAMEAALIAMAEDLPRVEPVPFHGVSVAHLATLYTITDAHVGMLAWGRETGSDWDLKIAERTLVGCFDAMIRSSPPARVGIVNQLGDFLHQDGLAAVTPTSGHNLDSDGRFQKIVETAIRILRRVVAMALEKHALVVLGVFEGNHDMVSSIWLRTLFKAIFENEPRVQLLESVLPYSVYQHGETLIGFHHGHLKKPAELPLLIAAQFPREWGSTRKRYVHVGHRHHVEEKEHSGITVIQHPTLAARDAYAARGGWIAERQVTAITYHEKHGDVARTSVTPEMLEPA